MGFETTGSGSGGRIADGFLNCCFFYKGNRISGFLPVRMKYFREKFLRIIFLLYFCNP